MTPLEFLSWVVGIVVSIILAILAAAVVVAGVKSMRGPAQKKPSAVDAVHWKAKP